MFHKRKLAISLLVVLLLSLFEPLAWFGQQEST